MIALRQIGLWSAVCALGTTCGDLGSGAPTQRVEPAADITRTVVAGDDVDHREAGPPSSAAATTHEPRAPRYAPRPEDAAIEPELPLEHPDALAYFFDQLAKLDEGDRDPGDDKVRIFHVGDSTNGLDHFPNAIREPLQARFGDGGPGFVLLSRYNASYRIEGVRHYASGWRHCYIAYKCRPDGHYGLGGVDFIGSPGAQTLLKPPKRPREPGAEVADRIDHAELWYAAFPRGGRLEVRVGGARQVIDTQSDTLEDRWLTVDAQGEGPHVVGVRAAGGGRVRAYGIALEREGSGIVYDSTALVGAYTRRLQAYDAAHVAAQVEHRDPDLLVFTLGGNDLRRVATGGLTTPKFAEEYGKTIRRMRAGKPSASCLVTSVVDHARSGKTQVQPRHVQALVEGQRRAATENGCAFFDTWQYMGGPGSIRAWLANQPRLASPDLKHLNHRGARKVGTAVYEALIAAYVSHRRETTHDSGPGAGEH